MRSATFKYTRILLNRSETTVLTVEIRPWEVPVLAAVNGEDRITVIGETPVTKMIPDPGAEYDRMLAKYKHDSATGQDYVAMVYGVGSRGVEALAKEIEKAMLAAEAPPLRTAEYDAEDDPLKGLFVDKPEISVTGAVSIVE